MFLLATIRYVIIVIPWDLSKSQSQIQINHICMYVLFTFTMNKIQGSGESRAESNQFLDNIYLGVSLPLYLYLTI